MQLSDLDLSIHLSTGTIPSTLRNMIQLQSLQLHDNQLTGTIPSTLGNLIQATYMDFSGSQLIIPSTLCSNSGINCVFIECAEITCTCCQSYNVTADSINDAVDSISTCPST